MSASSKTRFGLPMEPPEGALKGLDHKRARLFRTFYSKMMSQLEDAHKPEKIQRDDRDSWDPEENWGLGLHHLFELTEMTRGLPLDQQLYARGCYALAMAKLKYYQVEQAKEEEKRADNESKKPDGPPVKKPDGPPVKKRKTAPQKRRTSDSSDSSNSSSSSDDSSSEGGDSDSGDKPMPPAPEPEPPQDPPAPAEAAQVALAPVVQAASVALVPAAEAAPDALVPAVQAAPVALVPVAEAAQVALVPAAHAAQVALVPAVDFTDFPRPHHIRNANVSDAVRLRIEELRVEFKLVRDRSNKPHRYQDMHRVERDQRLKDAWGLLGKSQ